MNRFKRSMVALLATCGIMTATATAAQAATNVNVGYVWQDPGYVGAYNYVTILGYQGPCDSAGYLTTATQSGLSSAQVHTFAGNGSAANTKCNYFVFYTGTRAGRVSCAAGFGPWGNLDGVCHGAVTYILARYDSRAG